MPPRAQVGISLIELMVSITLGLLVLSGVLTAFFNQSAARNEVERTSRQIENGRYAVDLISTDLRLAGFFGEFNAGVVAPGIDAGRRVLALRSRTGIAGSRSTSWATTRPGSRRRIARSQTSSPDPTC